MDSVDQLYEYIGKKIRSTRKQRGISSKEFAKAIGLNLPSVYNIENGKQKTPVHRLFKIAKELDVNITELLPIDIDPVTAAIHRGTQKIREHIGDRDFDDYMEERKDEARKRLFGDKEAEQ